MEVVELADGGHTGQRHLAERRPGEGQVTVRVEAVGERVHLLPPRPEGAGAGLGAAAQRALKGVRVCVGKAGQG